MRDVLGDSLLYVIGGCLLLIFVLCGCLGGHRSQMDGGSGNDVGQEIAGVKASIGDVKADVKASIDALKMDNRKMNGNRAGQIKAMRDAVQSSIQNNGMSTWGLIVKDVVQGLLVVVLVYLLLRRQVKQAVCKWREERVDRRIQGG